MRSFNGRFPIAVCAWEVCVIGTLLTIFALSGTHIWSNVVWIALVAICGLIVVGVMAPLCRRFGRLGGVITGLACGLLPTVLIITWVFVAQPGFEASAGIGALAFLIAIPSSVGGMVAGIILSTEKSESVISLNL